MKLEELSSSELRRVVESSVAAAVVVPFGSVEGHGGHLPVGSDALLADVVGEAVADRLGAVLAPTVRVGCSEAHMQEPGALSVPAETLCDLALHIARSLITDGFRVIVLLSTHGGNQTVLEGAARRDCRPRCTQSRAIRVCDGRDGASPSTTARERRESLEVASGMIDQGSVRDDVSRGRC
jgi:creatinine amidohydrolase/Fe(II)-dependent formamide hydrolase-like protein